MEIQNQVGHRLRGNLSQLRNVLDAAASQGIRSLGQVADRVCEAFDLRDGRGRCQRASCRKALADLEAVGEVSLPAPRRRTGAVRRPRVLPRPVAPAHDVPGEVGALRELALVRVETDAQRLVWNTLMAHEHPRGAGPFVGHQLRYLVGSAHGWLGGVGFAASARRLEARDAWVGWDDARRRAHLHRVVGLCRMLIRPHVACRNLVSHVLGRAVRAVGEDFERLYGYRPWLLESFVDETEHTGASLRAANWVRVGESCGRGRNDRTHAAPHTRKAVYLYALEPAWRERLVLPAPGLAPLAPGEGLGADAWAANEFAGAPLGDARLSARLVESARHIGQGAAECCEVKKAPRDGAEKGRNNFLRICGVKRSQIRVGECALSCDDPIADRQRKVDEVDHVEPGLLSEEFAKRVVFAVLGEQHCLAYEAPVEATLKAELGTHELPHEQPERNCIAAARVDMRGKIPKPLA